MAKMGRPPLEEPMVHKVSVRFTEKEYQRLKAYAEAIFSFIRKENANGSKKR